MALHEFQSVTIEVHPRNSWTFFHRSQGVSVTCFSGGKWRPWWCLWLCTGKATRRVSRLSVRCSVSRFGGAPSSQVEDCADCDRLNVDAVWGWGLNVPLLATSYRYSGTAEVDGQKLAFSGEGLYS
jgi:hypothetical protein